MKIEITEKMQNVINELQKGNFIEKTNGVTYCAGIHISPLLLKNLFSCKIIILKDRPGNYSIRFMLNPDIVFNHSTN